MLVILDPAGLAGIGFARKGKHAAVALVFAQRTVRLDNVPLVPVDGKVVLREDYGAWGVLTVSLSSVPMVAMVASGRPRASATLTWA